MKIIISAILFLTFFAACNSPDNSEKHTSSPISEVAATIETTSSNDPIPFPVYTNFNQISHLFKQQSDTTYVINFWATWCKPCVEELPYFEQLFDQYKDQKVKVILVSLDFAKQIESKLVPFVKEHQLKSDVIAFVDGDYNSWIDKVSEDWDGAIPVTMIYNNQEQQFVSEQFESYADLEAVFKEVFRP